MRTGICRRFVLALLVFVSSTIQIVAAAGTPFRRGDANDDRAVDLSDGISILVCKFLNGSCPRCPDAADSNDDGSVDISDAISVFSFLFTGGATPPFPGPRECGEDPTVDDLPECASFTCETPGGLPPDPVGVATPLPSGVATEFVQSIAFLYEGSGIQTGVEAGSIDGKRAAVLRGRVRDTEGAPLPAVVVDVLDHPEWGQTRTRADGVFDLAVNGGAQVVVRYRKAGCLEVKRPATPAFNDWELLPEIVLTALDQQVTEITPGAAAMQVARGSAVTDDDGVRQATVLFPAGTLAEMVMPDGSTQPLPMLHVRATEYTVGDRGPAAMPGVLPPASGYTYAVELSVDEALAAGADEVRFSQPLPVHVDNFLGFDVGTPVPIGSYDRRRGVWEAIPDGRVIAVLVGAGGLADLDTDGDGLADDTATLAALGVTSAERQTLAALYPGGGSLWRGRLAHFTPFDWNWPFYPPPGAGYPPDGKRRKSKAQNEGEKHPCDEEGSILACESQTLGEFVPVTGTPFGLFYTSARAVGRTHDDKVQVQVSGPTVSEDLLAIKVDATLAGREYSDTLPPLPNQVFEIDWDGTDVYGRRVEGVTVVTGTIQNIYQGQYALPIETSSGGAGFGGSGSGPAAVTDILRLEISFPRRFSLEVGGGNMNPRGQGIGGWTLDVQHLHDPRSGRVYFGDGSVLIPHEGQAVVIAGNGMVSGPVISGGPATGAPLLPNQLQPASDGGFYVEQRGELYRVTAEGIILRVGCDPSASDCSLPADGMSAADATLQVGRMKMAPDGQLHFGDLFARRIWRIDGGGVLRLVAGNGNSTSSPLVPGALARDVPLSPTYPAPGPDGSVYFCYHETAQIWRVTPAGRLALVAGNGTQTAGLAGDGGLATEASLPIPSDITVDSLGDVYVAFGAAAIVARIRVDGIIERFAGTGALCNSGDGFESALPPRDSCLGSLQRIEIGPDGVPCVSSGSRKRILRLGALVTLVAGGGNVGGETPAPPQDLLLSTTALLAYNARGSLLVTTQARIREVQFGLPKLPDGTLAVPTDAGTRIHLFDTAGRHLATRDRLTGAILYEFSYDAENRIESVVDGSGNVTSIERTAEGDPQAIIAPGGQRTEFTVDANRYLQTITNPAGESVNVEYAGIVDGFEADSGLVKKFTRPCGSSSQYLYDAGGALISGTNAIGGTTTITRTEHENGLEVAVTTPTGQTTTRRILELADGTLERLVVDPTGGETLVTITPGGEQTVRYPEGTIVTMASAPDARFGPYLPSLRSGSVQKGALTLSTSATRTITTPSSGFLGIDVLTETTTINGRTWTSVFDRPLGEVRRTTPLGRLRKAVFDGLGRITEFRLDVAYAPLVATYNAKGFTQELTHGRQEWSYAYDSRNRVEQITDAEEHVLAFAFDAADRPATATFPGNEATTFGWSLDGYLSSFTPPGAAEHKIVNHPLREISSYTPPGNPPYEREYRLDGSLAKITLPGGREQVFSRDPEGRQTGITYTEAAVAVTYMPASAFPATLTRTPAGAGTAQTLAISYSADLPVSVEASGAATGTYTYQFTDHFQPSQVALKSGADTVQQNITRNNDLLVTGFGALTLARGGPNGAVSSVSAGSSTLSFGYSPEGWLASRALTAGGVERYTLAIGYDGSGLPRNRIETVDGMSLSWEYAYDLRGRLTAVERNGTLVEEYAYDRNGNRIAAGLNGTPPVPATYDPQDRLQVRGGVTYTFNADGLLAARGADTFTYSTVGELLSATVGGTTVTYDYDALRRRVRRTQGGNVTQYFYGELADPFRLTAYRAPSGTLTALLYDEAGLLVALERLGQRFFIATDQVGSPRVVTSASGTVARIAEHDSFGRLRSDSDPAFDLPIGFAGGLGDPVTGLVHFGLRDYEPDAGRWTARDPVFLEGRDFNFYAYVGSNPVGLRDPLGLFCLGGSAFRGFGGGVTACVNDKGWSFCSSAGVGAGRTIDIAPLAGLDETFNGFEAGLSLKLGNVAGVSAEGTLGQYGDPYGPNGPDCFKADGTIKANLGPAEGDFLDPTKSKFDYAGYRKLDKERLINFKRQLEAKLIWKSCTKRGN